MHLILTGATGLVGSACLHHLLHAKNVEKLSILSRRPVPMAEGNPKAQVIIHKDYLNYPEDLLAQLKGAEGCIWAQGVSSVGVSKADYIAITVDYPLAAAKAFSGLSSPFKFVYVSGGGATTTPSMMTPMFGTVKGQAETALLKLSKDDPRFCPYLVRLGYVDPSHHPEIQAFIPAQDGISKKAAKFMAPAIMAVFKDMRTPTENVGQVLSDLAVGDGAPIQGKGVHSEGRTLENSAFRRLAGL